MSEPEEPGPRYAVHASGVIAETLRQVQRRAAQEGRGEKVLACLRNIYERLEQDPTSVGEPLFRLPGLKMEVRTCVVRPLVVDFAICEDRPLVFLKGVKLLSEKQT